MTARTQHHHREAFCLMWYACERCGARERIWNSRDGVTPFTMPCVNCGADSLRVERMLEAARGRAGSGAAPEPPAQEPTRDLLAEATEQVEALDRENHKMRRCVARLMARLTVWLDDDQFNEADGIMSPEFEPPAQQPMSRDREIWRAALTLANNICVQESNRYNGDDATQEAAAASYCAQRIRDWIAPTDEQFAELLEEAGISKGESNA